jgi:hypothetical protein
MFSKFKLRVGHSKLRKQLKGFKRSKMVYNLVSARKVGVLLSITSEQTFNLATELVNFLSKRNLDVCLLAHFPGKEIPQQFLMRKNVNVFNAKEVNWYGKPLAPIVQEFIDIDFDILIDLSMQEIFPIRWIATLSKAKFKTGFLLYYGSPSDLIINVKQDEELGYAIEQLKHYLQLINNRFEQDSNQ